MRVALPRCGFAVYTLAMLDKHDTRRLLKTRLVEPRNDVPGAKVTGLFMVPQCLLIEFADCCMNGESKGMITIGRARYADIKLFDLTVSAIHCSIYRNSKGLWTIHDHNSTNGLYINGVRTKEATLRPGMMLRCGQTEFIVVGPDRKLPIIAYTLTTFLAEARRLYGSLRKAAAKIHRSRETIRRAVARHSQRRLT